MTKVKRRILAHRPPPGPSQRPPPRVETACRAESAAATGYAFHPHTRTCVLELAEDCNLPCSNRSAQKMAWLRASPCAWGIAADARYSEAQE